MMGMKLIFSVMVATCLVLSLAFAAEEGDITKGKALFNDPNLGGAPGKKSCNTCHPDGKGLEKAWGKKEFTLGGEMQKSLEEVINACIEHMMKGKPLDPQSAQMRDLAAYIRSLKGKI